VIYSTRSSFEIPMHSGICIVFGVNLLIDVLMQNQDHVFMIAIIDVEMVHASGLQLFVMDMAIVLMDLMKFPVVCILFLCNVSIIVHPCYFKRSHQESLN